MKKLILFVIVLFFSSCSQKDYEIRDIREISQSPYAYVKEFRPIDEDILKRLNEEFKEQYFKPWDINRSTYSLKEATWGFGYAKRKSYGQNRRVLSEKWFNECIKNSNFKDFNKVSKYAITVRNSNMRVLPTYKPIFYDPDLPGEGFPFDYNQNSAVKINTPLFVSQYSKDGAWVFVESNFALGWIGINDIAFIDKGLINRIKSSTLGVSVKDDTPLYVDKIFKSHIKLGTLFPMIDGKYVIFGKDENLNAKVLPVQSSFIEKLPIEFDILNAGKVAFELLDEPYGWGGLLSSRDCSSMTRDFFAPFGIYLKRNSYGQTKSGLYIPLDDLSDEEKKKSIIQKGKPFTTLLYLKGHVMLYIGRLENEPLVMHQSWGIKTTTFSVQKGRHIIGKSAITTLEAGKELYLYDKRSSLISRIKGMILVGVED